MRALRVSRRPRGARRARRHLARPRQRRRKPAGVEHRSVAEVGLSAGPGAPLGPCRPGPRLGQPPAALRMSREVFPDSPLKHRWSTVTDGLDGGRGTEVAIGARQPRCPPRTAALRGWLAPAWRDPPAARRPLRPGRMLPAMRLSHAAGNAAFTCGPRGDGGRRSWRAAGQGVVEEGHGRIVGERRIHRKGRLIPHAPSRSTRLRVRDQLLPSPASVTLQPPTEGQSVSESQCVVSVV